MPATTQSQDMRVRSPPIPLRQRQQPAQQLEQRASETPGRCQSACCTPIARPPLKRNTTTTHSTASAKSTYSTGTDGSMWQSEDGSAFGSALGFPDADIIDATTFEQILEMDDDEDEREFSKSIVYDFFTQAESTFQKMDSNLEKKDLAQLSALGHFLKGSSATLGLTKVKDSCEKIQNFGAHKDETGTKAEPDAEKCLKNCKTTIEQAKIEFKEVEAALKRFYREEGGSQISTA
ncbi:hypothetical protein LTR85_006500 [Meristemomyces frigidus]|nr:hypothetical protein LTR85_006500 [Meristemomyces frigidus]